MLPHPKTHDEYFTHLSYYLSKSNISIPLRYAHVAGLLKRADLSNLGRLIRPFYSHRGRPARVLSNMLRSLLAMVLCEFTSTDKWVSAMCLFPYYAAISGFDISYIPGVGIFFEFIDRIAQVKKRPRALALLRLGRKTDVRPHYGILERITISIEKCKIFSAGSLKEIFHD